MKNKWTKTLLISALAVMVIAVGAIGVFAQEGDAAPADETPAPQPRGPWGGHHGGFGGDRQSDLAEALGITVEELEAAQQEAQAARIAQAVEDGYLTQDQGNLMLAMGALKGSLDRQEMLASALGLTVEELELALEDGTLHELMADVTPAELQEGMQAAFEAALQQAVDDLLITEAQAELVREHMEDGFGFGYHGFGGHGRGGHGRGGFNGGGAGQGGFPGARFNNNTSFNNA
jgi:hypothetical protein